MTAATAPAGATSAPPRGRVFYGWWIVVASFLAQAIVAGTQVYATGVFLIPMVTELDWSRADFIYAQTFGQVLIGFSGFVIGGWVDRWGSRPLMLAGVASVAGSLFASAEVTELWQWILVRGVLFMLGAALLGPLVVNTTLSKWFVQHRGRAVGIAAIGFSVSGVVIAPALTPFVDAYGWEAGWRLAGVAVLALGIPGALLMRRQPEDYGLHPDGRTDAEMQTTAGAAVAADFANSFTRREAVRTSGLYVLTLAFALAMAGMGTLILFALPFMTDSGYSRFFASMMVTTLALCSGTSRPIWGMLVDRFDARKLTAGSFGLSAAGLTFLVVAAQSGERWPVAASFVLIGLGMGNIVPAQEVLWASFYGRRHLGSVRGVTMPVQTLMSAAGPLVVALYFERIGNYDRAFYMLAAMWGTASLLMLLVRRPHRASSPAGADASGAPVPDSIPPLLDGRYPPAGAWTLAPNGRNAHPAQPWPERRAAAASSR